MKEFFYTVLYEPLFNTLIWLYDVIPGHDLGLAIIGLTLLIKFLLFWPSLKGLRAQKALQEIQPKIEEIKKKYGDDKEELGKQIMQFYKENKVNPFSSCLPLLIQLPILWALFKVFFSGLATDPATGLLTANELEHLYGSLRDTYASTPIDQTFFGVIDLSANKNIILALLAGGVQFLQSRMLMHKRTALKTKGAKDEDMAAALNKQMMYIFPLLTVVFGYQFPAGVTLYWFTSTLFTWVQQLIFLKEKKKMKAASDAKKELAQGGVIDAQAEEVQTKKKKKK